MTSLKFIRMRYDTRPRWRRVLARLAYRYDILITFLGLFLMLLGMLLMIIGCPLDGEGPIRWGWYLAGVATFLSGAVIGPKPTSR